MTTINANNLNLKKQIKFWAPICLESIISAITVAFIRAYFWYSADSTNQDFISFLNKYFELASAKIVIFFILFVFFYFIIKIHGAVFAKYLFKYRWLIACGVFIICVEFALNGSSIGFYENYIPGDIKNDGLIFGVPRSIRSDEWALATPLALSQFSQTKNILPYFSEVIRGTNTDMFLIYPSPVSDIAILFRPFYWGYLFLGPEYGFSFFWCGRFIALFMVTFETCRLITGDKRLLSVAGAFLITFGPAVQWWFAINGFVEELIFGQLITVFTFLYLKTKKYSLRILYAICFAISAGSFLFTLYPAWEIPLFWLFGALFLWVIITYRKDMTFKLKYDVPIILSAFIILTGISIYILSKSWETVQIMTNTSYPGSALLTRTPGIPIRLFDYSNSFFLPYGLQSSNGNECETSRFISFAPLCWIISIIVIFKSNKKDLLLWLLLFVSVILSSHTAFNVLDGILGTEPSRTAFPAGVANIFLLIKALSLYNYKLKNIFIIILALSCSLFIIYEAYISAGTVWYLSIINAIVLFLAFYSILDFTQTWAKYLFVYICIYLSIFSGAFINPIQRGLNFLYDTSLGKSITEVVKNDPNALWAVDSQGFPISNYITIFGAKTINTTNIYPSLERWELIDEDLSDLDVYNRYAHINLNLSDTAEAVFELQGPDIFLVTLNPEELSKLGVKYVLSTKDLAVLSNSKIKFTLVGKNDPFTIYAIETV